MRIPRIYLERPLKSDATVVMDEAASVHLLRVLRIRQGDPLIVFNGEGGEYEATFEENERGRARLRIGPFHSRDIESPLSVTLAQGISRGERMDFALQKSVELGVARIVPLMTAFCQVRLQGERLERRHQHWLGVIIGACEQCGRTRVPALLPAQSFDDWVPAEKTNTALKLVLDRDGERQLSAIEPANEITLLIGPEGGLDEGEIEAARSSGFIGIRLGPRTLRTESAGIAAIAALQTLWGDLS